MPKDRLIYTSDKESLVRLAREKGFTDYKIVVKLTQGRSYQETVSIAKKWHEYLGISYGEFMKMARNRNW
ncbi:MAG: hypothetical protein ABIJ33_00395 [Patescibacteria group bacterium]